MHAVLPSKRFQTFGLSWSLNPGPFNIKEHSLITMMALLAVNGVYCLDVGLARKIFFNEESSSGFQLMLNLSQMLLALGLAGFIVQPFVNSQRMIEPTVLPYTTILNVMNSNSTLSIPFVSQKQLRMLFTVVACMSVYTLLPGYLFTALSLFDWVCWIAPNNVVVNQLFGYTSGLGLSILSFDWSYISSVDNPLIIPVRLSIFILLFFC